MLKNSIRSLRRSDFITLHGTIEWKWDVTHGRSDRIKIAVAPEAKARLVRAAYAVAEAPAY